MTIAGGTKLKIAQKINLVGDVTAMNIYYVLADFTEAQADQDVVDAAEVYMERIYTQVVAEMVSSCSLGEMTLYGYNSITNLWDNKGTGAPTKVGTNANEMLPHGVSALVRAYSTNPRSISRKYLPGFGEDAQDDGVWISTVLSHLAGFGAAWAEAEEISEGNLLDPAVWSVADTNMYALSGTEVVLSEPAYQRRRRPGVGM